MNIKINDKVIVKKNISDHSDYWESCDSRDADYLVITGLFLYDFHWDAYKDGKKIGSCSSHNLTANDFLPYGKREIQDVQYKDLIVDEDGDYRRVLGRVNDAVFVTFYWKKGKKEETSGSGTWSIQQLIDNSYTIVQEEESEPETITINGKIYNKKEVDERLEKLKEVAINKE